jgi:hypothetical protein
MSRTLAIVGGVTALLALLGGGLYWAFHTGAAQTATEIANVRSSPYFAAAEHGLSLDQELVRLLGGNLKFGEVSIKQLDLPEGVGSVQLDVQVEGANGRGHALVKVAHPRKDGPWQFKGGDYFPQEGPPLHLDAR